MTVEPATARLLAEILAEPASAAARLVYADHLLEQGDPRGELVQLQCQLEQLPWDAPARRTLDERIADLLAVHETAWTRDVRVLGFREHLHQVSVRRGFVEKVTLGASDAGELVPALRALTPLRELDVHVRVRDDGRDLDELLALGA
ncbi:MAG: TIGR02996 domain-containing protein, partial [Myxococcota bacterium]|nr:TIGR02996 domain-containing protein [Myxococcota bacterium]